MAFWKSKFIQLNLQTCQQVRFSCQAFKAKMSVFRQSVLSHKCVTTMKLYIIETRNQYFSIFLYLDEQELL